jgi:hypothetical protein
VSRAIARRTYVQPRRRLGHRLELVAVRVPLPDAGLMLGAGVAVAVVATSFASRGGSQLERTTWTEVGLMLAGALLCALALVAPRPSRTPARLRGGWSLAAFTALALFTAFSITWSLMPNDSWLEVNRTFAYLATFAGGLALGRLAPGRWSDLINGIAIAAVLLCSWSLATKVFPGWLAPDEPFARLRPPSDYWNSVGLTAAMGIPPLVWLASRRSGHAAVNALAWPGLGIVIVCLLMAYSRGALLAVGIGLALWLAIVPLRLRTIVALGGVIFTTLPLVAWAFAQDGLAKDGAPMALRIDAGQGFGALLLLLLVTLTVAGLAIGFLSDHRAPAENTRARAGRALFAALLTVPAVAILLLANAPGGIDGQVSKAWKQMTNPAVTSPSNTPQRLTETSSSRARYWDEALKIHAEAPWLGTGAGAFGTLRTRYRVDTRTVRHAHGYVVQTLADLGWIGLWLSLLAAGAWLVATARTVGVRRRDLAVPWDAERVGLAALACVVIVFGVHSAIDWTWFVPANAVPAMICAGWVASRMTLRERLAGRALEDATPEGRPTPLRPLAGVAIIAVAVFAAWSALQPVRSVHAQAAAFDRVDKGQLDAAASIAQIAHDRNPLSVEPLFDLSAIEQARGRTQPAVRALERAVDLEPANPETWRRLGRMRLTVLKDPKGALSAFRAALYLDPRSLKAVSDVVVTSRLVNGG